MPLGDEHDSLEVRTSLGSVKATGNLIVLLIVIMAGFAAVVYMIRDHDLRQSATTAAARAERMQQFDQMEANQKALIDAMNNMTYVLTLSQDRRERLNIDMPRSMREALLMQERPSRQ